MLRLIEKDIIVHHFKVVVMVIFFLAHLGKSASFSIWVENVVSSIILRFCLWVCQLSMSLLFDLVSDQTERLSWIESIIFVFVSTEVAFPTVVVFNFKSWIGLLNFNWCLFKQVVVNEERLKCTRLCDAWNPSSTNVVFVGSESKEVEHGLSLLLCREVRNSIEVHVILNFVFIVFVREALACAIKERSIVMKNLILHVEKILGR
jgi:hypothetical protein